MEMLIDGDDDQRSEEGSRCGKRCTLDLLARFIGSYREEETRTVRVREEDESVSTELTLGRGKMDECKNQENPTNDRQDNASSSSSSPWSLSCVESTRCLVVSDEPIRAEPLREVKPPVIRRKRPVKRERGVTPEWLVNLMGTLNGADAKLVIDKMIQTTDVNPNQGRLLIPFNQIVEMDFLNEAELNIIDEHQRDNSKKGVDVIVVASDGRKRNAKLRRWNMNCPNYALCSGWNHVVRENNLKDMVGQIFTLWSFHSQEDGKLYLAFFHQPPPPARELSLCEVALRQLPKIPTRKRPRLVCDPSPPRDSEVFGLNLPLVPVMAPLEAVQETLVESVTETTTTTVDLELRLWFQ